ncbi:MAG: hypothetical protein ACYSUZ_00860 [Planctomycetota bacterium]
MVTNAQGQSLMPVDLENDAAKQFQTLATNQKVHRKMLEIFSKK